MYATQAGLQIDAFTTEKNRFREEASLTAAKYLSRVLHRNEKQIPQAGIFDYRSSGLLEQ